MDNVGDSRRFTLRQDPRRLNGQRHSIFLEQMAQIDCVGADGERELVMARWGPPGPPQVGTAGPQNIQN